MTRRQPPRPGTPTLGGALIALGVVLLVSLGALGVGVWQQWRAARERGVDPAQVIAPNDLILAVSGIVGFVCYLGWMMAFLGYLRPRTARWLGRQFGVTIRERHRGTWSIVEPGLVGLRIVVALVDITLLMASALLPLAFVVGAALLVAGP